jgi:hypothetical protein
LQSPGMEFQRKTFPGDPAILKRENRVLNTIG